MSARPLHNHRIKEPIPAGPFMRWINDRVNATSIETVCEQIGWDTQSRDAGPRRLYRYRYGRSETNRGGSKGKRGLAVVVPATHYERSVVEDALHHAGVWLEDVYPRDLYPALYEDIPLEPEAWCPGCQAHCTPIYSECPWCNWSFKGQAAT